MAEAHLSGSSPSAREHKTDKDREDDHNAPADRVRWFVEPRAYPGKDVAQASVLNRYLQSVQLEQMRPMTSALADMPSLTQWQLLEPGNFSDIGDLCNTGRWQGCLDTCISLNVFEGEENHPCHPTALRSPII